MYLALALVGFADILIVIVKLRAVRVKQLHVLVHTLPSFVAQSRLTLREVHIMKAIVLSLIVLALPVAAISTPCLKKGETALSGSIETYKKDPDSFTKTGKQML